MQRAVRTAEIKKHLRKSSAAEPGAPGDSFRPALSVIPSPGASRSGPLLERGRGARKSEPWAPRPISDVPRAPLLPVLLSGFPQRPEGQGRSRGGERAGMRGPAGGRVRGAGAVSPRGAEPGLSEALSPAEGPLRRRRGHRFLHISGLRGIGPVSGARRPPRSLLAASRLLGAHPAPGFQRRPGARRSCGDGSPDPARPRALRARRLPRARLPGVAGRAAAPAGEMKPLEAPSDGDTGPPGLLAPPAAPSAARGPGDTKRGGFAVCPRSAGAAPKLRLGVNCMRAASLIHVSGVEEPRSPALGGRNVLYKYFAEGVLSPAKISRLMI